MAKELFAHYVKEKKLIEPEEKRRVGTNIENILCRSEKETIRSMYNKTIIRFGFCDIQNNQGLGKVISRSQTLRLITPTSTVIIMDMTKTSTNNCLKFGLRTADDLQMFNKLHRSTMVRTDQVSV